MPNEQSSGRKEKHLQRCDSESDCQQGSKESTQKGGGGNSWAEGAVPVTGRMRKNMAYVFGRSGRCMGPGAGVSAQVSGIVIFLDTETMEKHLEAVYTEPNCP